MISGLAQATESGLIISESVRWLIGQGALGFVAAVSMGVNVVQWRKNAELQSKFDGLQAMRVSEAQTQAQSALKVQEELIKKVSKEGFRRRRDDLNDREG